MSYKSNCLVFAVARIWNRGGYIIFRKSRWGYFPHVLWSPDLKYFESFSPVDPTQHKWPPLIFRGYIKIGDSK